MFYREKVIILSIFALVKKSSPMRIKFYALILFVLIAGNIFTSSAQAQIRISDQLQNANPQKDTKKSLFLIDFWATWCVPCATVSKYLSYVQKFGTQDLYILSLSQENPDAVKRHLEKHATNLAVAIDFEGESFTRYGVKSLPYGVLLNADGRVLWKGNPAELTMEDIERQARLNPKKIAIDKFVRLEVPKVVEVEEEERVLEDNLELNALSNSDEIFAYEKHPDYVRLAGSLKVILAYVLQVSEKQIDLGGKDLGLYELLIRDTNKKPKGLAKRIARKLKLKLKEEDVDMSAHVLSLEQPYGNRFWDTQQVQWEVGTPHFLIDDNQLTANDVSLGDVLFQMRHLFQCPVLLDETTPYDLDKVHDWQFHHRFFNLMQNNLKDNFGINIQKKDSVNVPIYRFD